MSMELRRHAGGGVSTHTLIQGDCLLLMEELPPHSVNLIVCDMPYGTTRAKWDTPIDLVAMWKQYKRILTPSGAALLFAQTPFDKVLGCSNLPWLRYEWIWEKPAATGHLNAKKMPMKAHENILVFYNKLPTYNPQKTSGYARRTMLRINQGKKSSALYDSQEGSDLYDSTERYPRSVLRFDKVREKEHYHPAQKPLNLIKWLVETYSNPGDMVLDNCVGSGTTGLACKILGRRFIGMDIESHFLKITRRRCEEVIIP